MYPVSEAFKTALQKSQTLATLCEAWTSTWMITANLKVLSGTVNVDKTASVRRTLDITMVDPTRAIVKPSPQDAVSPYGNELRPYRGLQLPGGSEMCPLGVFRIDDVDINDSGGERIVTVKGYDRSWVMSRNKFTDPFVVAQSTNYVAAMTAIVQDRLPGQACNFLPTSEVSPAFFIDQEADPWEEVTKIARAIGYEILFDVNGVCVARPEPVATADHLDWVYQDGANATMTRVQKGYGVTPGYNGVVVTGESTSTAGVARGEAWDTNQSSPTYYLGPYGKVPLFETSQYAVTNSQAQAAAGASLQRNLGATARLQLDAIPNPAHEAGDSVQVIRDESGVSDIGVVESFAIPLDAAGTMTLVTRNRQHA